MAVVNFVLSRQRQIYLESNWSHKNSNNDRQLHVRQTEMNVSNEEMYEKTKNEKKKRIN